MNMTDLVKTKRRQVSKTAAALTAVVALAALGSPTAVFAQNAIQGTTASQGPEGSWLLHGYDSEFCWPLRL
jgi:hypothetical protein